MSDTSWKPLVVSMPTARRLLDCSDGKLRSLIQQRVVETRVLGRRKMVLYASLERAIEPRQAA